MALCLFGLFAPLACQPGADTPTADEIRREAPPAGPVVAQVGERRIRADEVGPLAEVALELRREFGLPHPPPASAKEALALALETALLAGAGEPFAASAAAKEHARRRLARLFLSRVVEPRADRPITAQDLENALDAEIRRSATGASSDFYLPSRVSAAVLFVGLRPDLMAPAQGRAARLAPEEARALAEDFRSRCGDRVADLDRFLALGREFSAGHPTVRLEEFHLIGVDPRLADQLAPALHRALVGLDGNGAVSPVIPFEGGFAVVRRGAFRAGRNETVAEARSHLERQLTHQRRAETLKQILERARQRLGVAIYGERLPAARTTP